MDKWPVQYASTSNDNGMEIFQGVSKEQRAMMDYARTALEQDRLREEELNRIRFLNKRAETIKSFGNVRELQSDYFGMTSYFYNEYTNTIYSVDNMTGEGGVAEKNEDSHLRCLNNLNGGSKECDRFTKFLKENTDEKGPFELYNVAIKGSDKYLDPKAPLEDALKSLEEERGMNDKNSLKQLSAMMKLRDEHDKKHKHELDENLLKRLRIHEDIDRERYDYIEKTRGGNNVMPGEKFNPPYRASCEDCL